MRISHWTNKPNDPITALVCGWLPDGWSIRIDLENGAGDATLYMPNGDEADELFDDDGPFFERILRRVNYAREKMGFTRCPDNIGG